jgi:hypothetical protein
MRLTALLLASLALAPLHADAQDTLKTTNVQRYYTPVRLYLLGAADVMPAEQYGYKIAPAQMSFAEWIDHSTERNYRDCATLKGEANPRPKVALTEKAAVMTALRESFEYCDSAFAGLTDQKILASADVTYAFLHTTVHNNEVYGNVVGYLRANGITPPSTEMVQEMIKAKKTPDQMYKEMMEKYKKPSGE